MIREYELTPKPTLVAIDELQLHDLHMAEAAVPPVYQYEPPPQSDETEGRLTHEDSTSCTEGTSK